MANKPHLIIVSKNEILREGLRRILTDQGFTVERTVTQADEIDLADEEDTIVLIDSVIFEDALRICTNLRERFAQLRIVLMTDDYSFENVSRAFASHAVDGYLVKAMSCEPLAGALRLVALGEKVVPSQIVESLSGNQVRAGTTNWQSRFTGASLSSREIEILRCLVDGDPNKIISRRLNITDATVKVHIKAILRKLRVKNRTQAAIWAVERGLTADMQENMAVQHAAVA
jgi:two-component system nitrate/nitrite response regulator NarL